MIGVRNDVQRDRRLDAGKHGLELGWEIAKQAQPVKDAFKK